jgi:ankyrin repeat protein
MNPDTWSVVAPFCDNRDYDHATLVNREVYLAYQKFNNLKCPEYQPDEEGLFYNENSDHFKNYVTLPIVKYLCKYKEVNKSNLLALACKFGKLDVVKYLMEKQLATPLDVTLSGCIYYNHEHVFDYLMNLDNQILKSKEAIRRGFNTACGTGNMRFLRILTPLCTQGVHPEYISDISIAVRDNNVEMLEFFLENKFDPSINNNNAIGVGCHRESAECVEILLQDDRVDPTAHNNAPLVISIQKNNLKLVQLLLNHDQVNPSVPNNQPFREACKIKNIEIIKLLLKDSRINPAVQNNTAFKKACQDGDFGIAKLLLEDSRIDHNHNNGQALIVAYNNNHIDIVTLLIKHKNINANINDYENFLGACQDGSYDVIKAYIDNGLVSMKSKCKDNYEIIDVGCCIIDQLEVRTADHEKILNLLLDVSYSRDMKHLGIYAILAIGLTVATGCIAKKLGVFGKINSLFYKIKNKLF